MAILFGFSSVMLVMLLGQSRVFYSMANDGLLPKLFADVHPKYHTPYKCNSVLFVFVAALGGFLPGDITGNLTVDRNAVRIRAGVDRRMDHASHKSRLSRVRSGRRWFRWCRFSARLFCAG